MRNENLKEELVNGKIPIDIEIAGGEYSVLAKAGPILFGKLCGGGNEESLEEGIKTVIRKLKLEAARYIALSENEMFLPKEHMRLARDIYCKDNALEMFALRYSKRESDDITPLLGIYGALETLLR
jgi:hypothetical protein